MKSLSEALVGIQAREHGTDLMADSDLDLLQAIKGVQNRDRLKAAREQKYQDYMQEGQNKLNYLGKMAVATGAGLMTTAGRGALAGSAYGLANIRPMRNNMDERLADMLRNTDIGLSDAEIDEIVPQDSMKETIDYLVDKDQWLKNAIDEGSRYYLGDNPDLFLRSLMGAGTTGGFRALSLLANPFLGGAMEAFTNSAMNFSDNYTANKDRMDDALRAANYQAITEAPLDIAIEHVENLFSPKLNPGESYLKNWAKGLGVNIASESTQETMQEVIGAAGQKTYDDNNVTPWGYLQNLGGEIMNTPKHAAQVVPETIGSTVITSALTGLLGWAGGGTNSRIDTQVHENDSEELKNLKNDYNTTAEQIQNSQNQEEQEKLSIRLSNLENAIRNYGKDAETVRAEGLKAQTPLIAAALGNAVGLKA